MDTRYENWRTAQTQDYLHEYAIPGQSFDEKQVKCTISDGPLCGPLQVKLAGDTQYLSLNESAGWLNHSAKLSELSRSMWERTASLLKNVGSDAPADSGVQVVERAYWFILKFFTYDNVTTEYDYPIRKSFEKVYTATENLIFMFPNQVFLSQR